MKPRDRILAVLNLAGDHGLRSSEIGEICGLWAGTLFIALWRLEDEKRIESQWDVMPEPRARRYKIAGWRT